MKISEMNPYVRWVRMTGSSLSKFILTRNYDCRLFFFGDVGGHILIEDTKYKLSNDDVVFLPPGSCYRLLPDIDAVGIYSLGMDFDGSFSHMEDRFTSVGAEKFDPTQVLGCVPPEEFSKPVIVNLPELRSKFERCYDEFRLKPLYFRETVSGVVKLMLTDILRKMTSGSLETGIVNEVMEYIKNNYGDINLSNDSIAKHFEYHPYYLSRVIKQATGKPLHKYVTEYRIQMAKNLLVSGKLDVAEVALACGYTSASYFTKAFRDECGITPTVYRREYSDIV